MTHSTAFRARALAFLCLGAAISSSVLAVPVPSAQTSELAIPLERQADFGPHRDSGVLTVDDSEHDRVGNDRAPSTSISPNLDFLSKYCGGDDSKATPRDPINPFEVQKIYDRLQKGLDYLKRYVDLTGKKKNLPKANPDRVKEILHYANEISKSIEATPSPPQSSQKNDLTVLDNHTLLTRFYCYQIYELDNRAMPGTLDVPHETLSSVAQEEKRLETLRSQNMNQYRTKGKKSWALKPLRKLAQRMKPNPKNHADPNANLQRPKDIIKSAEHLPLSEEYQQQAESSTEKSTQGGIPGRPSRGGTYAGGPSSAGKDTGGASRDGTYTGDTFRGKDMGGPSSPRSRYTGGSFRGGGDTGGPSSQGIYTEDPSRRGDTGGWHSPRQTEWYSWLEQQAEPEEMDENDPKGKKPARRF
ncbi:hypothetical protein F5878DRAFT_630177 [Lentinula raphanica]|uniref:Secreted protein n=1 Tax=Lentinula raphanica TaxID=153919 RepID=A0AA38UDZ7_9AGAR|nr:hypothetical protein F5878DRAFT_630177 [Lentinula raphanica]